MNTQSSSRRFLPRFSLANLLMLMVVIGLGLTWHEQRRKLGDLAQVVETQKRQIARLTVNSILSCRATDGEKAAALAPFVKLGQPIDTVEQWGGPRESAEAHGLGDNIFK